MPLILALCVSTRCQHVQHKQLHVIHTCLIFFYHYVTGTSSVMSAAAFCDTWLQEWLPVFQGFVLSLHARGLFSCSICHMCVLILYKDATWYMRINTDTWPCGTKWKGFFFFMCPFWFFLGFFFNLQLYRIFHLSMIRSITWGFDDGQTTSSL